MQDRVEERISQHVEYLLSKPVLDRDDFISLMEYLAMVKVNSEEEKSNRKFQALLDAAFGDNMEVKPSER